MKEGGPLVLLALTLALASGQRSEDFVGFSYSQADVSNPSSRRFVSFLSENLNINANFLPRYGSFEATKAGVYSFNFAFLSPRTETTVLALRKNGKTLVTGLSEAGGLNPSAQAALTYMDVGDVVQLEIVQGRLDEGADRAYTSFSGWLIGTSSYSSPTIIGNGGGRIVPPECCCPSPPIPIPTAKPPYPAPSYLPPIIGPPAPPPTTTLPTYILTTTSSNTLLDWEGRQQEDLNCCDSLLLSALSPDSPALAAQDEKFGVYRLQYVDRSATGRGRATFKHIERDLFLFYVRENTLSGWIVGPQPGLSSGGLFVRSGALCVEHTNTGDISQGDAWQYYQQGTFHYDDSVSVSCFSKGYLDGRRSSVVVNGKTHYHHHRHFHYHQPRALQDDDLGPAYNVRANTKFVEATFLYPHNYTKPAVEEIIEAKKDGFVGKNH